MCKRAFANSFRHGKVCTFALFLYQTYTHTLPFNDNRVPAKKAEKSGEPSFSGPSSDGLGAPKPQRFTVTKWSGVALWSWDTSVDSCAICRNLIVDVCIECQGTSKQLLSSPPEGKEGEEDEGNCRIAWGVCQHAFHYHCISRWVKTRQVCPLDNRTWEFMATQQ